LIKGRRQRKADGS